MCRLRRSIAASRLANSAVRQLVRRSLVSSRACTLCIYNKSWFLVWHRDSTMDGWMRLPARFAFVARRGASWACPKTTTMTTDLMWMRRWRGTSAWWSSRPRLERDTADTCDTRASSVRCTPDESSGHTNKRLLARTCPTLPYISHKLAASCYALFPSTRLDCFFFYIYVFQTKYIIIKIYTPKTNIALLFSSFLTKHSNQEKNALVLIKSNLSYKAILRSLYKKSFCYL